MSKGSSPRPFDVTQEEFANRFDAIFKKPKPDENDKRTPEAADEKENNDE